MMNENPYGSAPVWPTYSKCVLLAKDAEEKVGQMTEKELDLFSEILADNMQETQRKIMQENND